MTSRTRLLYRSSNGDCWQLVRDDGSDRVFVRHEPNVASGGRASEIEIAAFLTRGGHAPEQRALLRLIGTLVQKPEDSTGGEAPVQM